MPYIRLINYGLREALISRPAIRIKHKAGASSFDFMEPINSFRFYDVEFTILFLDYKCFDF